MESKMKNRVATVGVKTKGEKMEVMGRPRLYPFHKLEEIGQFFNVTPSRVKSKNKKYTTLLSLSSAANFYSKKHGGTFRAVTLEDNSIRVFKVA